MFFIILPYVLGGFFTLCSTFLLSYLSIATSIGPWITPTIILLGQILLPLITRLTWEQQNTVLARAQSLGAVGGIIATGVGFSLPMLYFLEPHTFNAWLASPVSFCLALFVICITAGALGITLGSLWAPDLCQRSSLTFPVSMLTARLLSLKSMDPLRTSFAQASVLTLFLCFLRDKITLITTLFHPLAINITLRSWASSALTIKTMIWPSVWALGFIVGPTLALPLIIGFVVKYTFLPTLPTLANMVGISFPQSLTQEQIIFAFCSGLMVGELLLLFRMPLKKWLISLKGYLLKPYFWQKQQKNAFNSQFLTLTLSVASVCFLMTYAGFSLLCQSSMIILTIAATYFICLFSGRTGLIPFGRFSVFVVLPLFLCFTLSPLQATLVCMIFNICAATASDFIFDYKNKSLCHNKESNHQKLQWVGLVMTALCIGLCLWVLFSTFSIGTECFCAQRSKTKAILLQSFHINYYLLFAGIVFSAILRYFRLSISMIFGGIVMPYNLSLGLALGSAFSYFIVSDDKKTIFCAGMFCTETLWLVINSMTN